MNRFVLAAFVVGAGATAILGVAMLKGRTYGTLTIRNGSDLLIQTATVKVSGSSLELENIHPSETRIGTFKIRSDSHYDISVKFAAGKSLNGSCGYVTNGVDSSDHLVVLDDEIRIGDSKSGPDEACTESK